MNAPIDVSEFPAFMKGIEAQLERPEAGPALDEWLTDFMKDVAAGFESGHSQFGEEWAKLKRRRPAGHDHPNQPLIDTEALMKSVTGHDAGTMEVNAGNYLMYGTSLFYAAFHQSGTSRIPARPFLNVNDAQIVQAVSLITNEIIKRLGA